MEKSKNLAHAVGALCAPDTGVAALFPCPFCKGGSLVGVQNTDEAGKPADFQIECQICQAQGPHGDTLAAAGKRWNARLK
jgi:Lar family restriction alleviation protein